ncbi:MAG: diadenylate cyclase CdaA [Lachnospiraceae bacterium]|nr:diadenylate cyclase CdaA [Lachnospiraceae bacterium]
MQFLSNLWDNILNNDLITIPYYIKWTDIVEIILISFLAYSVMVWIKTTRAWSLLKGIVVIAIFVLVAAIFGMNTILWIVQNILSVAVIAIVVILQPELRKALEELGRKNIISSMLPFDNTKSEEGRFSDRTINEIAKACIEMGRVKTGALIVIEQNDHLNDYERTGIDIDAMVSSQLLINIFEHNTPLHDGAVLIRGNRIISATCYLPLSDNRGLSKELGTRHRAGIGISEVTDSLTIIVSEETGRISIAYQGEMERNVDVDGLKKHLLMIQEKPDEDKKSRKKTKAGKTTGRGAGKQGAKQQARKR